MSTASTAPDPAALLPPGLAAEVERATGARIATVKPRGGGGASREGAELVLVAPDGRERHAYMNYDVHRAGAGDDESFRREAAVLEALSGPFAGSGVRTARFIAAIPDSRALLAEHVAGDPSFNRIADPDERTAVAAAFMAQLATLHAIDVAAHPIAGMGPIRPIADAIAERLAVLRARNRVADDDPLITLALDWLEAHVPPEPARPVIVHGDAGPGNFLFADGEVTALLDWELVHYGDPMADLAMLCLRMLIQPFVPPPQAFAAYEAAGGVPVELARVRFWRLFFQVGFAGRTKYNDPAAPPPPNLGMNMVYSQIHRRVLAEALAEAAGIALPPVDLPDAPEGPRWRSYQIALDDLRDMIVPRLADQQASVKAKGLARLVKWWRDSERYEAAYDAATLREIASALDLDFADVEAARQALAERVSARAIDPAVAIRLCHAEVMRESALMADAMGGLARSTFAPLE